jgi:O-antigen ligase
MRLVLQLMLVGLLGLGPLLWGPFAPSLDPHDVARVGQVVVCALFAVCLLRAEQVTVGRYGACVILLFIWGVLPVAASANVSWALREWVLLASLCALAHVLSTWEMRDVSRLLQWLAAVLGLYGLVVLALAIGAGFADPRTLRPEALPGYSHHRFFNHVQTAAIPVIAYGACCAQKRWSWILGTCLAAQFALLLFTGGRATMLSLGLAGGWVVFLLSPASRPRAVPLCMWALAGCLTYYVFLHLLPGLAGASAMEPFSARMSTVHTMSSRLDAWQLAWRDVRAHPVLGIGPMHFASHSMSPVAHPHNSIVQLAAEWGVPFAAGSLALVAIGLSGLGYALHRDSRARRPGDAHVALGAAMTWACTGLAIDSLFSGNIVMPAPQTAIAVCCGAAAAWVKTTKLSRGPVAPLPRAALGTLALGCFGLLLVTSQEAFDLDSHLEAARALSNLPFGDADDPPRYWSNGRF